MRALVMLGVAVVLGACAIDPVQGDGVAARSERTVSSFDALEISGPFEVTVEVREGVTPALTLDGDANVLSMVSVRASGQTLQVSAAGVQPVLPLTLRVVAPGLVALDASEGARVKAEHLRAERLRFTAGNDAAISVGASHADTLVLRAHDNSSVAVLGSARIVDARAERASDAHAPKVLAQVAFVHADFLSSVHVNASEAVRGNASSSSMVRIFGGPRVVDVAAPAGVVEQR